MRFVILAVATPVATSEKFRLMIFARKGAWFALAGVMTR
jgi:hypothetical protein